MKHMNFIKTKIYVIHNLTTIIIMFYFRTNLPQFSERFFFFLAIFNKIITIYNNLRYKYSNIFIWRTQASTIKARYQIFWGLWSSTKLLNAVLKKYTRICNLINILRLVVFFGDHVIRQLKPHPLLSRLISKNDHLTILDHLTI